MAAGEDLKRKSKMLSLILRHQPGLIGLELEPGGWVEIDRLLEGLKRSGRRMTRDELDRVVRENDKQRFAFDSTGTKIRASQGHSVPVDLELEASEPPNVLYHGTHPGALAAILAEGLTKMQRHAVHLSPDVSTAVKVGGRRGKSVVLRIDVKGMAAAGHAFYRSENGVWLTDSVPPEFLAVLSGG